MSYIKQKDTGGDTYNLLANQDGIDVNLNLDAAAGADSQVKLKAGSNITLTEAGTNSISIDANGDTYTLEATQSGSDVEINLDANAGVDSKVTLKAGTNITLTEAADEITIDAAGGGGSPGGANTQVQFNDGGAFGGDSAFTFDKTGSAERVTISANTSDKILDVQQQAATDTLAMQVRSSSSQGLKVNNTGIMGIGIDPASGFAIKTAQDIQILGDVQHLGSDALQDGSASSPMFSRTSDKNTGTFFPGADQLGFSTGGSERLRFGSAGQIGLGGANYGAAGEVLTSNGPSSAPTWQAGGGGTPVPVAVGSGIFVVEPFSFTPGRESNYPLWANINSTNSTAWSGNPSTTQAVFMPFQVPSRLSTLSELCFRTSNITSGGGPLYMAVYGSSPVTRLPGGSPLFSTNFTLTNSTEFEFAVSGVTGLTPGDILYIAWLGYTGNGGDSMNVGFSSLTGGQSGGYALNFPRGITSSNLVNFVGRQYTALRISGITPNTFPTVPITQSYETLTINTPLNMSARYT